MEASILTIRDHVLVWVWTLVIALLNVVTGAPVGVFA